MAKENYDELIDQKLMELYDVLTTLNSLKEKTAAVQQVVESLAQAGKGRVAEIESSVGRIAAAVANAGKERIDGMQTTANTFSVALEKLVQASNEGTAKMSKLVAELKGMPLVEELREFKQDNAKQTEELKSVIDAVGSTATKAVEEIGDLITKLGVVKESVAEAKKSFVDGQKNMVNEIGKGFQSVDVANSKIKKAIDGVPSLVTGEASRVNTFVSKRADGIMSTVKDVNVALTKLSEDLDADIKDIKSRITTKVKEAKEKIAESIEATGKMTGDGFAAQGKLIRSTATEMSADFAKTQKLIKIFGGVIIGLVIVVGVELVPLAIRTWKIFLQ